MDFVYDLKDRRSLYLDDWYNTFTYDFRRHFIFKDLRSAWTQIALWYDKFMDPSIAKRNPKIYIDSQGVIVNCYDDYDYPVEIYSISIIKRKIIGIE